MKFILNNRIVKEFEEYLTKSKADKKTYAFVI